MKLLTIGTAAVLSLVLASTAEARFTGDHQVAACGPMVVQDAPLPRSVGVQVFPAECRVIVNSAIGLFPDARCTLLIQGRMMLSGRNPRPITHVSKRCLTPWERHLKPDPAPASKR